MSTRISLFWEKTSYHPKAAKNRCVLSFAAFEYLLSREGCYALAEESEGNPITDLCRIVIAALPEYERGKVLYSMHPKLKLIRNKSCEVISSRPGKNGKVHLIVLAANYTQYSREVQLAIIAHEFGHLLARPFMQAVPGVEGAELEADRLAIEWGFANEIETMNQQKDFARSRDYRRRWGRLLLTSLKMWERQTDS